LIQKFDLLGYFMAVSGREGFWPGDIVQEFADMKGRKKTESLAELVFV